MTRLKAIGFLLFFVFACQANGQAQSKSGTLPEQSSKLLVLGDSLTSGLYAPYEQATFVSLLGEFTGSHIARRNSSQLPAIVLLWQGVKSWQPDTVVIEIGLNDVSQGTLPEQQWFAMYKQLIVDMQSTGAQVVVCTMFAVNPLDDDYAKYLRYNEMIRKAAQETNAGLADLWGVTETCTDCVSRIDQTSYFAPHYHGDDFHPNEQGHRVIAETIFDVLKTRNTYLPVLSLDIKNECHTICTH